MGLLILFNGGFILLCALTSFFFKDAVFTEMLSAAIIVLIVGFIPMILTKNHNKQIKKIDGFIIVSLGWLLMSLTGAIPYIITNSIPNFTDAFFESSSGYTTTGATILNSIETLPKSILLWRSTTHWIGGMGIIVLAIAVLPILGIGGAQLFMAETTGPNSDKLHPRITDTARRLWYIYLGYTVIETLLLSLAGMSFFDAINHTMSTISTGGFSTKNNSIAFWNDKPIIQYIIIVFMILAGTNFTLAYFIVVGKVKKLINNEEFKTYIGIIVTFLIISSLFIIFKFNDIPKSSFDHPQVFGKTESIIRHTFFQVVSMITGTGYITADYTTWGAFLSICFFGMMFLGGSAGSTSGGVKIVRHLLMIKNGLLEFKRALHSNAIIPVRYNDKIVNQEIIYTILGFFILYMLAFIIGSLGFSLTGLDFIDAIGLSASTLGNVGPALGNFGPSFSYSTLTPFAKIWSTFLMILGRLELFTVLIIFTPFFWKKN